MKVSVCHYSCVLMRCSATFKTHSLILNVTLLFLQLIINRCSRRTTR
jgi:hypothetical protein